MKLVVVVGLVVIATTTAFAAPKPSVTADTPMSKSADLDVKAVAAAFTAANAKLLACYAKPGTTPTSELVHATFTIGADGKVAKPKVEGGEPKAAACMEAVIGKLVFAKPKGGAAIDVTVPLELASGVEPPTADELGGETNGGFGYGKSGYGPGGAGTGWGSIGSGRYGTIGHGSGTSSGTSGGSSGRATSVPSVSIGQPTAKGDLDKAIIRRYVKRNISKIQYCYEKALVADKTSKLHGDVTASFTILATGLVGDSTAAPANGMSKDVATCVAGVIKQIEFPKPKNGGDVVVHYPFSFRPAGAS